METPEILEKYACYYNSIEGVARHPMDFFPTMDEANMGRKEIQRAYKEIRAMDFDGTIIDYVCYVATVYAIWVSKKKTSAEVIEFWKDNFNEYKSLIICALRLIVRYYGYFYDILGEKPSRGSFEALAGMWFDYQVNGTISKG